MEKYKVRVPETSANLGAGFDVLGLALNIYNRFTINLIDEGVIITGCDKEFQNEHNLVYTSMKNLLDKKGYRKKTGFKIEIETNIKECSGLGSSATCIVGGLLLGAKLLEREKIFVSKEELIDLAIEIEGHGDNVVPAFLGALTVIMKDKNKFIYKKVEVSKKFSFATITSNIKKESTNHLRELLKKEISLQDTVYNISHSAMTLLALQSGDIDLLKKSMKDKIHEKYRKTFIENFDIIREKAQELNCLSLNISGSGPSLILIYDENFKEEEFKEFLKTQKNNWIFTKCEIDEKGATYE
ncbi:MAG: homoserine kinase [Lachnospirales bacterium]